MDKKPPKRKSKPGVLLVKRGAHAKFCNPEFKPKREGDVGFDLVCVKDIEVPPGACLPPTNIPVETQCKLPPGTFAMYVFRSGTHNKYPMLRLCPAPIDNGYTGPLDIRVRNVSDKPVTITAGVALAQLVLYTSVVPEVREVNELPATERGDKGFGSTDK